MKRDENHTSTAPIEGGTTPVPSDFFVRALRSLLRPLVHLLVDKRFTFPQLSELLKGIYVEVADRDFALEGKRQTNSRLHLLTGIHRKDVRRLREAEPDAPRVPRNVSLGAQLVARWVGSPHFTDAEGHPRSLSRRASDVNGPTFASLVEFVSKDIRPRAILDEWLRLGVVQMSDDDRVELVVEAFVPQRGDDEKVFYFGRNLRDHIAAAARNLAGHEAPLLERSVYYDALSEKSVAELAALSEELGMDALRAINRRAMQLQRSDAKVEPDSLRRMNFGVFFYEEQEAPDAQDGHDD